METYETQEKAILEHLKKGRSITPLDALREFNCLRLSDRIFRLRRKGYPIATNMVENGKKRYASYKLEQES